MNVQLLDGTLLMHQQMFGDMVIGSELSEDGNTSNTDGFLKCLKIDNKCLSYKKPGYYPYEYYCRNTCGDGIIVYSLYGYYSEYCGDGNTIDSYKFDTSCTSRVTGCIISPLKICEPVCGDSILVNKESVNQEKFYHTEADCKPKCQNSCKVCVIIFITYFYTTGKGCKIFSTGYVGLNNVWHSICGASIFTEDKE